MEMQIQAVLGQWAKLREAVHSDTIRIEKTARILKVISAADTVLCAHDVCVCVCGWLCVCVCVCVCVCLPTGEELFLQGSYTQSTETLRGELWAEQERGGHQTQARNLFFRIHTP